MRRILILTLLVLAVASCGGADADETETGSGESDPAPSTTTTAAPSTSDATTTAAAAVTTTSTTLAPATTAAAVPISLDCAAVDQMLGVLWNDWVADEADDPAFGAFSPDPPAGRLTVTAFDPSSDLLAAVWDFPNPEGDGLARGLVWTAGEITGERYYLDGADPIETGDASLLDSEDFLTLELGLDGDQLTADCWFGPKPALISADTPLTIYGLGPIQPGMTLAEVTAALPPFDVQPTGFADQGGTCFHVRIGDTGIHLQLEGLGPDSSPLDGIVRVVSVSWGYQTPSGLGFGSTQAEVEAALGDQLEISPHEYVEGFYLDFVPNDPAEQDLRLRFVVTSEIVTEMRAGFAGWTGLVEGCA